jgi:hypothetical protein
MGLSAVLHEFSSIKYYIIHEFEMVINPEYTYMCDLTSPSVNIKMTVFGDVTRVWYERTKTLDRTASFVFIVENE